MQKMAWNISSIHACKFEGDMILKNYNLNVKMGKYGKLFALINIRNVY